MRGPVGKKCFFLAQEGQLQDLDRLHPPFLPSTMNSFTPVPADVLAANESGLKLFNRWDAQDVEVKDISLTDYIQVRNAILLPHTAGRYAAKQFRKAQMPIVERLVNR